MSRQAVNVAYTPLSDPAIAPGRSPALSSAAPAPPTAPFVPPAHPHSHHLHNIPPRDKSTRTLVLDHTAWLHGRARLAQAKCQLGLPVTFKNHGRDGQQRTGFSDPPEIELASSDDDEAIPEAEEPTRVGITPPVTTRALRYGRRARGLPPVETEARGSDPEVSDSDGEENQASSAHPSSRALSQASALAAQVSGIERVLFAMLSQPPRFLPPRTANTPSASPKSLSSNASTTHTGGAGSLPNGLRLRLALLALSNDMFARQPSPISSNTSKSYTDLSLAHISSQPFHALPTLPGFHTLTGGRYDPVIPPPAVTEAGTSSPLAVPKRPPPLYSFAGTANTSPPPAKSPYDNPSFSPTAYSFTRSAPSPTSATSTTRPSLPVPTSWVKSKPSATFREPASPTKQNSPTRPKRAVGRTRDLYGAGCHSSVGAITVTGTYGNPVSDGEAHTPKKLAAMCGRHLHNDCTVCKPNDATSRVGAGLLPRGLSKNSLLAEVLPRFLRLSALIAMELGREYADSEGEVRDARPTRKWYALLCGLLTRAVLEGYIKGGWKGAEWVEVLLGVGIGIKDVGTRGGETAEVKDCHAGHGLVDAEDCQKDREPDEMPGLLSAAKVLWPGLVREMSCRNKSKKRTGTAEAEYVKELEERMEEFLTISPTTPSLSSHLISLSERYPAEPVEHAALLFCEAAIKWRGRPELEENKAKHSAAKAKGSPTSASLASLIASPLVAPPQRAPIDGYFIVPPPRAPDSPPELPLLKRPRSASCDEAGGEWKKRETETPGDSGVEEMDWVGPYGI